MHPRWISVALWLLSCILPAVVLGNGHTWIGAIAFLFGPLGLIWFVPCWLANPFWLASVLLSFSERRKFASAWTGVLAAVLGLTILFLPGPKVGSGDWSTVRTDEFRIGAVVWLGALLIQAVWSVMAYQIHKAEDPV